MHKKGKNIYAQNIYIQNVHQNGQFHFGKRMFVPAIKSFGLRVSNFHMYLSWVQPTTICKFGSFAYSKWPPRWQILFLKAHVCACNQEFSS